MARWKLRLLSLLLASACCWHHAVAQQSVFPPTATSGGAPGGSAGGDLSGTYPNPSVAKIHGTTVPTNSAADQVALTTASAVTAWTSIPVCLDSAGQHLNYDTSTHTFSCGTTGGAPSGAAGGVLSGTYPNPGLAANTALSGTPTAPTPLSTDKSTAIATTAFVQGLFAALNQAVSVQAATTTILPNTPTYSNGTAGVGATLTAASNAVLVIDGYTVLLNDRVLVNNQASALQNGVYTVSTLGTVSVPYVLTRATDFNTVSAINGSGAIPVLNGTANNNTIWVLNVSIATIGTSAINYSLAWPQSQTWQAAGPA